MAPEVLGRHEPDAEVAPVTTQILPSRAAMVAPVRFSQKPAPGPFSSDAGHTGLPELTRSLTRICVSPPRRNRSKRRRGWRCRGRRGGPSHMLKDHENQMESKEAPARRRGLASHPPRPTRPVSRNGVEGRRSAEEADDLRRLSWPLANRGDRGHARPGPRGRRGTGGRANVVHDGGHEAFRTLSAATRRV